ncbi:MAG: PD40 domain-containing protein [Nitrospirae bacterium]|nr:PD40 domain-containing protein [Nitrospirota bacterium]
MMGGQKQLLCTLIALSLLLFSPSLSHSADFIATTLGDQGNVTVMEVSGNYDANNPDASTNTDPRKVIAKEFYRLHKDEYDFLVIFSNFDVKMPEVDARAFYLHVKNDTQGIGQQIFDNSWLFGSNGKLHGTIDMGNITALMTDPLEPTFETSLDILSHELMHRWGSYVKFMTAQGVVSSALLGKDLSHWSFLLNSYGSVLYGNQWQDNGNGTFTSIAARKYYSPLDLYLMGFIDKSQVPPMLLIDNPDIDPKQMPETGITITGTPTYVTIDQIIAAEGERIPGPTESQKSFKTAFIFITAPGTFTGDELYGIENIRNGWVTRYSVLSDGKGIMQVSSALREDIPTNPGITLPPVTPRTVPPKIEDGVAWLMNDQKPEGHWLDITQTAERDTAEAARSLKNFAVAQQNYSLGLQWLNSIASDNTDYLSRKIEAMAQAGQDVTMLLQTLISRQNLDGGWGSNREYMSSTADTASVLKAFSVAGYADPSAIGKAVAYLKAKQNPDQGWGSDNVSTIQSTANVLTAFNRLQLSADSYQLTDYIANGFAWLLQKQNPDGGFGNSPSTIYDTAHTLLTLGVFDIPMEIANKAVQYILSSQSEDGSWNESAYQTALAVEAVWKATVDPDLSIKNTDITFIPASITTLPSNIVINAVIGNTGRTGVAAAKVALYEGAVAEANKIGEQTLAFPGQSSVNVTFNATARDGNEHRFYIVVDPENLIREANESNNTTLKILYPLATYDFEVLSSDLSVSANPVDIFKDVKITSKITNKGTMNAYNVQIRYFIDEAGAPLEIGTSTVNIPAGATITSEIIWKTNKAGVNLPLTVLADPFNTFVEILKENNRAVMYLTVNGSTEPNLTISYKDMVLTPSPANERGSATISALVKNEGFSTANNIAVNFYKGVPGVDGVLLGSQVIPSLIAGTGSRAAIDWTDIQDAGERIIYVKVDPLGQITEISKDDNDAFVLLDILSLPDLAISTNSIKFNPAAPKDGDIVAIVVTVKNLGMQSASNVSVKAVDGDTVIGTKTISVIAGNAQGIVLFSYDTAGKSGAHQITVAVDPDNAIVEQSDDNNSATRTFGVQNANLWLTEPIFSPNGDGIKDSTQLFFRLDVQQTVRVIVVNKKSETVRTFSGIELTDITGGNITWDGLNDIGTVVADGQYQIKVVDLNNNVLGSLLVILDNNRSPLTEAIGTKYLLNTNLTCNLPLSLYENWQWLSDDGGIIFSLSGTEHNVPQYPSGIYFMSPTGDDITSILPMTLSENDFADLSSWKLSPDKTKIAFLSWKYNAKENIYAQELWTSDIEGKNLRLLIQVDQAVNDEEIFEIKWSPDGKYLLYNIGPVYKLGYRAYELWIINIENKSNIKIDSGYFTLTLISAEWSPDGTEIAYLASPTYEDDGNMATDALKISDLQGNKKNIYLFNNYTWWEPIHWLENQKILVEHPSMKPQLWLFDASGNGNHIKVADDYDVLFVAPDRQSLAFHTTVSGGLLTGGMINISNMDGNITYQYQNSDTDYVWDINTMGVTWAPDSQELVFSEMGIKSIWEYSNRRHYLTVLNMKSKATESFDLSLKVNDINSYINLFNWLPDNAAILASQNYLYNYPGDLYVINSETGAYTHLLSNMQLPWDLDADNNQDDYKSISPLGQIIAYYPNRYQASGCYYDYYKSSDLWGMSSLLNLTADLSAVKNKSYVILKGTAADLNFEGYMLEYADAKTPTVWNLVGPPSDLPVINNVFTTWVPPYEGVFFVRLTVWDKAGNIKREQKRVSWGLSSSITNLYKSTEIFSPNGDGTKDTVSLNYTVLEPIHLEFTIYDENNKLIRTFLKDHTTPCADNIIWDGRDNTGDIVPDGKYTIKVFDYEFFLEVDNTPPDLDLELSEIKQYQNNSMMGPDGPDLMTLVVLMRGLAYDKNLKYWIIEYGEGDNPLTWYEYSRGMDLLAAKDNNGNVITDPIGNAEIAQYHNQEIASLAGQRFRITVEDHAGNKRTVQSNMLEERMLLYFHSWGALYTSDYEYFKVYSSGEYPSLELPKEHILQGLETISVPITIINLQYWSDLQWHDASQQDHTSDGDIYIVWDRGKVLSEIGAVRLRAIDMFGQEHYSNTVMTKSQFTIDRCAPPTSAARNYLFEKLTLLKMQIQSADDIRFAQWTDYHIAQSPDVPTGTFSLAPLPDLRTGAEYHFRMIGIGESGREYIGEENSSVCDQPKTPELKLNLYVKDYAEADCGLLSDGKSGLSSMLSTKNLAAPITLKTLSYYIQINGALQLLRQFDLTKESWGAVGIEASAMAEGSYPVSAVLDYFDTHDYKDKELTTEGTLIVDRTLPEARITYPDKSQTLCPVKRTDARGDWFALPIEGIALDNIAVKRYELYYGFGEAPETWNPALTRVLTKDGIELVLIKGKDVKGKLGDWYVEGIHGTVSLKLKVIDIAGNVTCYTTSFTVKEVIDFSKPIVDKPLFSPNRDGLFDDVNVTYEINEYATVDLKVYPLALIDNDFVLGQSPVGTIASGISHLGGEGYAAWEGLTDAGIALDGHYGIAVIATDACGNTRTRWTEVGVDNAPPLTLISYPVPGDIIGNIIEVKGTVSDDNFRNYQLEAAPEGSTSEWRLIANNANPVMNDILGKWNTYGLNGIWTVRLTGYDAVGNKNETYVDIDLGERKDLIKDLDISPKHFSPNNDGKRDVATIKYELSYASNVKIEILNSAGTAKKTYTTITPSFGSYTYIWDGTDAVGLTVPDGTYVVKLTAELTANPSVNQFEAITVVVDTKAPVIDIKQPVSGFYIKTTDISVNGSLSDPNIMEYSMTVLSDTGTEMLDQGNQDRIAYHFGMLSSPAEGAYTLNIKAKDLAENSVEENIPFVIDRTPPKVTLDTPKSGEYFGHNKAEILITGSIEEKNLETFELRYALGDTPVQWTELLRGTAVPTMPQLFTWKVGRNDNMPDGNYTLSLFAKDKAGLTGESKVKVTVDNTAPETVISSPIDGSYIKSALDIKGTAFDANLDKCTVEFSEGNCQSAFKWSTLMSSTKSVKDGVLARMQILPAEGDYCIKVAAIDKLDNRSEARAKITIDTQPPAAPSLSGRIENRADMRVTWAANTEPDIAGYDLYREGKKLNTTLLAGLSFLDADLTEGTYTYMLKAIDYAGNESKPSNDVTIKIDLTGPNTRVRTPQDGARVSGLVDIKGTAYSADDFKEYRMSIGKGQSPSAWMLLRTSPVPEPYGILAQWDTAGLTEDEQYTIKLEADDINGNTSGHQITVTIDNRPPAVPLLLAAVPSVSDVQVTWKANTEQDLAGYFLYRNDQLANVQGIVIGNLKPYLIAATVYSDKGLPDGTYKYSLLAMDSAGNLSDQSNSIEVTIDTRPPHAAIVDPANMSKFDKQILLKAESLDIDIAGIQFQYRKASDQVWITLGGPISRQPYITFLDPIAVGLTVGEYHFRAVATDKGGKTDPTPEYVTLTYSDVTAPDLPMGLKALTKGTDVTLTWMSNPAADLDGYNIYRTSGKTRAKINAAVIKESTYPDANLGDGSYDYEVTSIDTSGNESKQSNSVSARIYAPLLVQPYTPTGKMALSVIGRNAAANATVQIFAETVSGPESRGATSSDASGNFALDFSLALGENKVTSTSTDAAGNISRVSDMVVVVYNEPPLLPKGLQSVVNGHDINLTWVPNTEVDLVGYNIFRGDEKLNSPVSIISGNATSSSYYYYYQPSNAFDGDPNSYWLDLSYGTFSPVWLQIDLPSPELITHMEINWLGDVYAGSDYEVQTWSGYAWITLKKVAGNTAMVNSFDFKPSYRTDKIRISITGTINQDYYKQVGISEISILRDNLLTEASYNDLNLSDEKYAYSITAVDYYGFESLPSEEVKAEVGDVIPPAAPISLTAATTGQEIKLSWSANAESDLAGYNLYGLEAQAWIRQNSSLITDTAYRDAGLPNGTYTYKVTAVDSIGNESLPSNEASADVYVADTVAPAVPVLFFPTIAGLPIILQKDRTDVMGFAEPGSSVTLYKSGISVATTSALEDDDISTIAIDYAWGDATLSPDGTTIAYMDSNYSLWVRDLASGTEKQVAQYGNSPVWSSDGSKIAFQYNEDRNGQQNYLIGIYDIRAEAVAPLTGATDDPYIDEYYPSWSSDGSRIAFISYQGGSYNIWFKDFMAGDVKQLTHAGYTVVLKLSPDGKRLAYIDGDNYYLYVMDIASGESILIDDKATADSLDWSPDSRALLFSSSVNGNVDLYRHDFPMHVRAQLTSNAEYEFAAQWSPEGKSIFFGQYDGNWNMSLRIISADAPHDGRLLSTEPDLYNLSWLKSGAITFADGSILFFVHPKGYFMYSAVALEAGENLFTAIATDSSGNSGQPSDEISVTFETSQLPDIETLADDIYLYPAVPVDGQQLLMNIVVWNRGQTEAINVVADVYIQDAFGNLERIKSVSIPLLSPGSGEIISISWATLGRNGANKLFVVLDPANMLTEQREDNNIGEKEFYIVTGEGVSLSTVLSAAQLMHGQDTGIDITIVNNGIAREGVLNVAIEDENGYSVALLDSRNIHLAYGSQEHYVYTWNTGSTYAGMYRVRAAVGDASGIIAEKIVPFTILPEIAIEASVVTDKALYGPHENVQATFILRNNAHNYIIPDLKINNLIMDAAGTVLFAEEKDVRNMLSGITVSFSAIWDTGLIKPGNYYAAINIYDNGQMILSKTAPFIIESVVTVSGSLLVSPSIVLLGNTVHMDYAVLNAGNSDAMGLTIRVLVEDPETQAVLKTFENMVDLGINSSTLGQFILSTQGLGLKNYTAALQYVYQGDTRSLAKSLFSVRDGMPPAVTLISPSSGSLFNSAIDITAIATDDASGVDWVEFRIDNGSWKLLPIADPSSGRFATTWLPARADEGTHTIDVRATDKSGNASPISSTLLTIDTTAPVLIVSTLSDGSWTKNELLNVAGIVTDNIGIQQVSINDTVVPLNVDNSFSYPITTQDGENVITVTATDLAGNQAIDTRTINFDRSVPVITIITPADNIKTMLLPVDLSGTVDEQSSVAVAINGSFPVPAIMEGNNFSLSVIPDYGINTIEATATDRAGNTSTAKRTILFDDRSPSLAVIDPTQDTKTNQTAMTLRGKVEDLTEITVRVTMDGNTYVPAMANGTFELPITFTAEKVYQIYVTATDEVGNETAVQRNVLYDITAPILTVDSVISPTSMVSQVVTGLVEAGAIVSVSCPTANIGVVTYPTPETWAVTLLDMEEGTHIIEVTATDEVSNISQTVTAEIIVDLTSPLVTIAAPANGTDHVGKVDIIAIVTDTGAGVGSVEYQIDSGDWKLLSMADPAVHMYSAVWLPVLSDEGTHMINIRASDRLGFMSNPVSVTFEVKSDQNSDIEIEKTIPNVRNVLLWINDGCHESNEELTGSQYGTGKSFLSGYPDGNGEGDGCREENMGRLSADTSISNEEDTGDDEDSSEGEHECRKCLRSDLVERVLGESATSHSIVYSAKDFQHELRNPYYTDILILGNRYPLEDHYWEELREKVNAGVGLVSSLWMRRGTDEQNETYDPILGIRYKGRLPGRTHKIRTVQSPITGADRIDSKGKAERIETGQGTAIAGWLETDECEKGRRRSDYQINGCIDDGQKMSCESPAIVLNKYGKGRAVFIAFDIGETLNDKTYSQMTALIKNSLTYAHSVSDINTFGPGSLVPVEISLSSLGSASDLKVTESYSTALKIYDPTTEEWITANPWINRLKLGVSETASILYYALLPDRGGIYTLKTDISYLENGIYNPYKSISNDLVVANDFSASLSDVLCALDELDSRNSQEVKNARRILQLMLLRDANTRQTIEANIHGVLSAIHLILGVNSDTFRVRTMMDELLKGLESRYYYLGN